MQDIEKIHLRKIESSGSQSKPMSHEATSGKKIEAEDDNSKIV